MWPFKRNKTEVLGNPEPGLDAYAAEYRLHRIGEIATLTEKSREDAAQLADMWLVQSVQITAGPGSATQSYIPHPIWDDEWLLARSGFEDRSAAIEYVREVGGELLGNGDK